MKVATCRAVKREHPAHPVEEIAAAHADEQKQAEAYRDCAARRNAGLRQLNVETERGRRIVMLAEVPRCKLASDSVENRAWNTAADAIDQAQHEQCTDAMGSAHAVRDLDRALYDSVVIANPDVAACAAVVYKQCLERLADEQRRALLLPVDQRGKALRALPTCDPPPK